MVRWFSFFFFKQKTAYEVRISDWSSDVCSSDLLDSGRPSIRCHQDKTAWSHSFHELIELRQAGTIGQVIDFLRAQAHMRIPEAVIDREDRLAALGADPVEGEPRRVTQLRRLREVPYTELMAVEDRKSTRLNSSH